MRKIFDFIVDLLLAYFLPTHWHEFFLVEKEISIYGREISGPVMRRRVGRSLEYRPMSDEEMEDYEYYRQPAGGWG